jgi:hypothetical protein
MGQGLGFLTDRLSVNEKLTTADDRMRVEHHGESRPTSLRIVQTDRGPAYLAHAPRTAAIVGYLGGSSLSTDSLSVQTDVFGLNFAAVTAISLTEQPLVASDRVLVTLAARAENQGSVWNAARTSVGDVWGKGGPPIAERVPATVRVKVEEPRRVTALSPDGSVAAEIASEWSEGWLVFSAREGPPTLHYELSAPAP